MSVTHQVRAHLESTWPGRSGMRKHIADALDLGISDVNDAIDQLREDGLVEGYDQKAPDDDTVVGFRLTTDPGT